MGADLSNDYQAVALDQPSTWRDSNSHPHTVQFYGDDSALIDEIGRSVGAAVGAGDSAIVVATSAHRDRLAARLRARGVDLTLAARQGRFVALDAAETLSKISRDGWPDARRFVDVVGGTIARARASTEGPPSRVVVFGEMVAVLWEDGQFEAAIYLERLWNDLRHTHSFDLCCAYPLRLFPRTEDGPPVERICAEHTRVVPAESYPTLADDDQRLRAIALLQQKAQALETEIAERKQIQSSLRRRESELAEAVGARDVFLSVAAHELRTPITVLRLFAQLLLRENGSAREILPERLASALRSIEQQTGKLNLLVARLLDTAQIQAAKLRIEPVRTDLVALLRTALACYEGRTSCQLSFEGPSNFEAMVDPSRFEQVVTNLVDNAIKFSPDGGPVALVLGTADDGGAWFSVTDHGVGIAPDRRETVFDRFHHADGHGHLAGLGLSLYLTREIIQLHGGSVRIEDPGHPGTRMVVALPPLASHA